MVLLKCTHGGVARSRGSGIRPRQNYRYLGCNAFIKFAAKRDIGRDDFVLRCVEQYTGHSHECCKEAYDMLSENRKVSDPQTIKDAAIMLKTKGNKKLIRDELASRTGKRIIMKGIHNLNARLNLDPPGCDDDSRTLLEQFTSQAGNVADIITDENDEVVFICIQTAFQRDMMQAYPEVLLVDATHKTNRNGYQMLGIMGHTSLGSGFPFFVALNSSSTKENLTAVLKSFKEHNPSWTHSVFGVIDKDFVEEDVLTATMPDVFWSLCQFHVVKFVATHVTEEKFGLDRSTRSSVKNVFRLLVHSQDSEEYDRNRRGLLHGTLVQCFPGRMSQHGEHDEQPSGIGLGRSEDIPGVALHHVPVPSEAASIP